jgi:hypothetical protein
MMLLGVDKTFDCSSMLAILLTTILAHALRTCHMHKNTLGLGQMLLQKELGKLS